MSTSPMIIAADVARWLESDPVAAAQVKEHIRPTRLVELLDLSDRDLGEVLAARSVVTE